MDDMTLSVLGMYQQDETILNSTNFPLPEDVDRTILLPLILSETAELEVVYPDPTTFKIVCKAWANARASAWERIIAALDAEYNPIHNYDRTETEAIEDEENIDDTESIEDETSGSATGQVTGFNSNTFTDDSKTIDSGSFDRDRSYGRDRTFGRSRTLRAYGNIGVTTNMDMVTQEVEGRKTDIYRIIADEFTRYFCILVY